MQRVKKVDDEKAEVRSRPKSLVSAHSQKILRQLPMKSFLERQEEMEAQKRQRIEEQRRHREYERQIEVSTRVSV